MAYYQAAGVSGFSALCVVSNHPAFSIWWVIDSLLNTQLARLGVEVRLVGHSELRSFRQHQLGLPDKDDDADALALAIYGWDYLENPRRFLQVRTQSVVEIRSLVLRLAHLNRVQSPIINRARQDLAWQFPEVAGFAIDANWRKSPASLGVDLR